MQDPSLIRDRLLSDGELVQEGRQLVSRERVWVREASHAPHSPGSG
jgi:hypothetical protein